mgnify:CR=1 FL=1
MLDGDGFKPFGANHPQLSILIEKLDDNLYFLQGGGPLKVAGFEDSSFDKWRAAGFDRNSIVADPLFVDPANGDFRLKPQSPAWKLGFKPIPFEKIGITKNE